MTNLVAAVGAVVIQFAADPADPTRVTVAAEPVAAKSVLSLHLLDPQTARPGPALFADVGWMDRKLSLRPRFGLSRGASYSSRLILPDGRTLFRSYRVPAAPPSQAPRIVALYPRGDLLPANLLKFYLYFSEPMREGRDVFDLIHLADDRGARIHSPWRRKELWDAEARRLTLWIHPGRIKRGVNLRETFGPVLEPDREYRLIVDGGIRSAGGVPMGETFERGFLTTSEDRDLPVPNNWQIERPMAGTRKPIVIHAQEGFDHILLARHQWIEDRGGGRVSGRFEIAKGEQSWTFHPESPWGGGGHLLCVDEWLEDLSGNTPTRPYERDVDSPEPRRGVTRVMIPAGPAARPRPPNIQ